VGRLRRLCANFDLTFDYNPGLSSCVMRTKVAIRTLLAGAIMVFAMVTLPTAFARSAHQCCMEEMAAVSQTMVTSADRSVAAHHQQMLTKGHVGEYPGCDISCCGLAVASALLPRAISGQASSLMHSAPLPSGAQACRSASTGHITPPPRKV